MDFFTSKMSQFVVNVKQSKKPLKIAQERHICHRTPTKNTTFERPGRVAASIMQSYCIHLVPNSLITHLIKYYRCKRVLSGQKSAVVLRGSVNVKRNGLHLVLDQIFTEASRALNYINARLKEYKRFFRLYGLVTYERQILN